MGLLSWIVFGALAGWVASYLMRSRRRGIIRNLIVGLIGSVIGGWIATLAGLGSIDAFTLENFLIAVAGSVLFIWFMRNL